MADIRRRHKSEVSSDNNYLFQGTVKVFPRNKEKVAVPIRSKDWELVSYDISRQLFFTSADREHKENYISKLGTYLVACGVQVLADSRRDNMDFDSNCTSVEENWQKSSASEETFVFLLAKQKVSNNRKKVLVSLITEVATFAIRHIAL